MTNNNNICSQHVRNLESAVGILRGYVSPIIVLVGVFGNLTALHLFIKHRPWNRFSVYAMTLAISDSLVLITNTFLDDFLGRGLYFLTNKQLMIKLDTISLTTCRLLELIGCWFVFNSGVLLVAFSADRVACLERPLVCRSNGGIRIATIVCSTIVAIGLIFALPYATLHELVVIRKTESQKPTLNNNSYNNISTINNNNNNSYEYYKYNGNNNNNSVTDRDYLIDNCGLNDCKNNSFTKPAVKFTPEYLSCAIPISEGMGDSAFLSFIFSTVLTYMIPCILLVFINCLIVNRLVAIKSKRRKLFKSKQKNDQLKSWSVYKSQNTTSTEVDNPTSDDTMTSAMQRQRFAAQEHRKEIGRVIALLIMSCFYLCFTFPVSVALTIRVGLSQDTSKCDQLFYGHLSRLLTSIKDINYALNGYSYAFFFQFYRTRLMKMFTCCGLWKLLRKDKYNQGQGHRNSNATYRTSRMIDSIDDRRKSCNPTESTCNSNMIIANAPSNCEEEIQEKQDTTGKLISS